MSISTSVVVMLFCDECATNADFKSYSKTSALKEARAAGWAVKPSRVRRDSVRCPSHKRRARKEGAR